MAFSPIQEIIEDMKQGRMVVVVDDAKRENEGDLTMAAEKVTPEAINFMAKHGRGLICLALTAEKTKQLDLPPMAKDNTSNFETAFTISIDAKEGTTTGISAADRATTILAAIDDKCRPLDLARPGHIFPLEAKAGGVLTRAGQTESGVDLARLAGLKPAGVICEVMNDDGTMARVPQLEKFCKTHDIKICSIADLIEYRRRKEHLIDRTISVKLPTSLGTFDLHLYRSKIDEFLHLALCTGGVGDPDTDFTDEPVFVRVHSECLTGDIFGSSLCDCGTQLSRALQIIQKAGRGVVLYMRQEGRGIGLENKLRAYALQQGEGLDTVEANERLGFAADERDYGIGAQILKDLGVSKMRLLSNNPRKYAALAGYGLEIVERVSLEINSTDENVKYLKTKRDKLGHTLSSLDESLAERKENKETKIMGQIKITAGGVTMNAELNDSETAKKLQKILPTKSPAKVWGDEIYFDVPMEMDEEDAQATVPSGTIAFWPVGNCFCIFFGQTPASPVNVLGTLIGDPNEFQKVTTGEIVRLEAAEA